jgi:HEAT repeat protein
VTANERWRAVALAGHTNDVATATAALVDPDPVTRELALGALDRLGALPDIVVTASFTDPDHRVRRRAATLAGGRPDVSLLAALADPDPNVVETAAWACGEQEREDGPDDRILARLIELAGTAEEPLVREAAVAALGAFGDERGLPAILAACTDKPAVRRRAVLALAPFDGDDVDAALQLALTDRDWQVRQSAEDVVRASAVPDPDPDYMS